MTMTEDESLSAFAHDVATFSAAYWWRQHEFLLRRAGAYDSADAARQVADNIESGSTHRFPQSWIGVCRRDLDDDDNWRPFDRYREAP